MNTDKKRIIYFHQHFSTPRGTTGIRSYEMARRLVNDGHHVTMICGSYDGGVTGINSEFINGRRYGNVDGINIIEFNLKYSNNDGFFKRSLTFISFALKSISLALTMKYDIVFATSTPLTAGIPGIFARWFKNKQFVFEVRDLWPELPKKMGVIKNPIILGLMSILEFVSYRSAHRCIGLSPGIVNGIVKRGVQPENVAMIPNGCDLEIFNSNASPWRPERVEHTDLMAIFTGTHGIANGLDAVLDAAAVLLRRGRTDIKIVLIGQGKKKGELQKRVVNENLTNVIFHDPVDKERLSGLMAASDIGLQLLANVPAFYYGTSPNKFFDYIAAGLPVLNNYPGWISDMLTQNQCGFAVQPDDSEAFANALEFAADNREQLRDMGKRSYKLAVDTFDRHKLADKWMEWVIEAKV
ncbi:glycosyltransferase family 4 protein [Citrobacter freundii]|uniref:glycosyltransferase family 4 protein n=1 Tax=Citrobacter freundii TaxID=546 RepID=UPI0022E321C7|nr:glycosyltransferase family 4 protein [Citrobacter freundii]ELL8666162.1 glycosyltransferase family 4 protein [Citrobacter freundii]